jgi:hypothetical protein
MAGKSKKTKEQIAAFETALANGDTIENARLAAGYAPSAAKRGKDGLPKELMAILVKMKRADAQELMALGRAVRSNLEEAKDLVFGRLSHNAMTGSDAGTLSAKTLGSIKEIDCFTKEVIVGVQINQLSPTLEKLITLEAEES